MVLSEDGLRSPPISKKQQASGIENGIMFSPRFRSVVEMAGWDEESLLIATLVVEDTPDRESKNKNRSPLLHFLTPPSNSRRKRRAQRKSPVLLPVTTLDLGEDEVTKNDVEKQKKKIEKPESGMEKKLKKVIEDKSNGKGVTPDDSSSPAIPCIDRLREELSCAICLEICYEPSTTPCGHSFCKKCLRSAADKCGKKCPKCRQLISNGRSCTINTVLWNTIQLLFPQEIEARKAVAVTAAAGGVKNQDDSCRISARVSHYNARNGTVLALNSPESEERISGRQRSGVRSTRSRTSQPSVAGISNVAAISNPAMNRRRRDLVPNQDGDAALALRLQREEFMDAFRGRGEVHSLSFARANLRAMASRAMDTQSRRSRESR